MNKKAPSCVRYNSWISLLISLLVSVEVVEELVNAVLVLYPVVSDTYVYISLSVMHINTLPSPLILMDFHVCSSPAPEPSVETGDWLWATKLAPKSVDTYNFSESVPIAIYWPLEIATHVYVFPVLVVVVNVTP